MIRIIKQLIALAVALVTFSGHAAWPEQPVKFIVPFPPGGPADNAMRVVAKKLGDIWGQPAVVENRPGAPGMVYAANAAPDGYTFVLGAGSHIVTSPLMNNKLAYKPERDFAPVSLILTNTPILTIHPGTGIKSVAELIANARKNPGKLNYGSAGVGSPGHLMMEMFNEVTKTSMTHVPYKGGAPAVAEMLAGHVQLGANATPSVLQHVIAGKLQPLAVASPQRDRSLPTVPTMLEAGVPNMEYLIWYGIFAPAKTPQAIVEKVSSDIQKTLADPQVAEAIRAQGSDPEATTPQKFAKMVAEDRKIWGKLIRDKKLSLQD